MIWKILPIFMVVEESSFDSTLCDFNHIIVAWASWNIFKYSSYWCSPFWICQAIVLANYKFCYEKLELDANATWVGEGLKKFFGGTCCQANSCTIKGLVRWLSCLLTRIDNFYSTNQVPTTFLTWEQTSMLRLLIWWRQIIRPPNIYKKKCIKNELNKEEVEIM